MNNPKYQHTVVLPVEVEHAWQDYTDRILGTRPTFNGLVVQLLRAYLAVDKPSRSVE